MPHDISFADNFSVGDLGQVMVKAVRFLLEIQGLVKTPRPITVHVGMIHPLTQLELMLTRGIALGICGPMPEPGQRRFDSGTCDAFSIQLSEMLKPEMMAITLAHESVHLHQMLTGRFRTTVQPGAAGFQVSNVWNGQEVPNGTPYMELPWEVEAHAEQAKLASVLVATFR